MVLSLFPFSISPFRVLVRGDERGRPENGYRANRAADALSQFDSMLLPFPAPERMNEVPFTEPESDDALMAKFCEGDQEAFSVLYARYAPQLETFLRRFVRDRTLAEDLLQTTFLSFVRARGRYVSTAGVRAWIYAIAANAARDALRRRGARREEALDFETLDVPSNEPSPGASDPNVARAVEEALQQLPPEQREAVLLHKMQGLSFPEVAVALGTTVGAAKVRAHRGYQRLRVLLAAWENA
jgi:RNA polymerase sigma-70 factor (ECF subfamily)